MSLIYKIALTFIRNVGHVTAKALIHHFGSAEAVFKAGKGRLMRVPGIGALIAEQILDTAVMNRAERELRFIEKQGLQVLYYTDEDYPERLRHCPDAPVVLYYKGSVGLNRSRILSIVGTRQATPYGKQLCRQLAETLAPYGVIVVSGLAYGIDAAIHQESLNYGLPTVGVLAHGSDRLYPYVHTAMADKMVLNGGLLTEFPSQTNPDKENFPKRNRIIAGLADATIVVEAAVKGGALITADIANSYNRDVYAFPGKTTDKYSEGCNFLIRTNRAGLISSAEDLVYNLGWDDTAKPKSCIQTALPVGLNTEQSLILETLGPEILGLDVLAVRSGIPQSKLSIHLLDLEMQGNLRALPGKMYQLN